MKYVEGTVIPVLAADKDTFLAHAKKSDALFLEHGATRVVECWADDVQHGKKTDFFRAVDAQEGETVVFSWIEWPDKATRDAAWPALETDPRFAEAMPMPFDGSRMVVGGFEVVFSTDA